MFTWLLYNALCALPLALLALAVGRVRRASPALEHALWCLVLVRLVLPPLPHLGPAPASAAPRSAAIVSSEPTLGDAAMAWMTRNFGTNWSFGVVRAAFALFLALALVIAWREIARARAVQRCIGRARAAPRALAERVEELARALGLSSPAVRVLQSSPGPFVWGLGRPVLVLPESGELPSPTVLAHELAHLSRRDHWSAWLELAALVLHFWNPLFWLARARLHASAELACDAWVVQRFPAERASYARLLLDALESAHATPSLPRALHAIGMDRRGFEQRLRRILEGPAPRPSRAALLAAALLALASLPGLAAPSLATFRAALPPLPSGVDRASWAAQLERSEERLRAVPDDGAAHRARGMALLGLGRSDEAARAFERQIELGYQVEKALYNLACAHARSGEHEIALDCLTGAAELGLPVAELARADPDLAGLREQAGFERLLRELEGR